ncbi:MAG: hypothetical protein ABSG63_10675 [Spirochaetia bacterium]
MEKPRSLVMMSLGLACLLAMACQTARTPVQSPAGAEAQSKGTSTQLPATAETQAKETPIQKEATVERQALPPRQPASQNRTATSPAGARPAAAARQKSGADETMANLKTLYSVVTGHEINATKIIDSAIAAAIVVLGIGAFAAVLAIRHRRLTPSSSHIRLTNHGSRSGDIARSA